MSDSSQGQIPADLKEELKRAWQDDIKVDSGDQTTLVLAFGRNFRLSLYQTFKAAWHAAKVYLRGHVIVETGNANPLEIMEIASDSFATVTASLEAVRDPLSPLAYIACVVLSQDPAGMTRDGLNKKLESFLEEGVKVDFPWYLGITGRASAHL